MLGDSVRRRRGGRREKTAETAPRARRRASRRRVWPWVIAALFLPFGIGYAVAALALFPPTEEAEALAGGIPVPELVGRTTGAAERQLAEVGLGELLAYELPHPDADAGEIIAQDPLPGQHLRPGAAVRVGVSSGPPRVRVPDVVGFPLERARELLQRLGFEVATVERESEVPTGRVIGIAPEPGTEQGLPATATLVVSIGAPPAADTSVFDDPSLDAPPQEPLPPADTMGPR